MIDLHLHTIYSDGTDTVKELLTKAEDKKLDIISITDHDTVNAYKELDNKEVRKKFSGKIIVGTELKAHYKGIPLEVLGYGIDYTKINIKNLNTYEIQVDTLNELKKKAKELKLRFDDNIMISKDNPKKKYAGYCFATELLKYKENKSILLSIGPMFDETNFYRMYISNKNSIFYYDEGKYVDGLEEIINNIHAAGGIAILAHPLLYPFDDKFREIEKILKEYDLDGLECEYPLFSKEDREKLKSIAKKYKKYITGGSDYHAKAKPNIDIGTGINNNLNISCELIDDWVDKVKSI